MNVDRRPPPAAGTLFSLLAVAFGTLFSAIVIWLAFDQNMLLTSMDELQTRTLPQTIEQQRLARNLEVLRLEGERVLHRDNPSERRQALFVVSLIASHPSILEHAEARDLTAEAERFLSAASRVERIDAKAEAEWLRLSRRLTLLADDISVDGVNLATRNLRRMEEVAQQGNRKLMIAIVLATAFVVGLLFLIRRTFIRPLQQVDRALIGLQQSSTDPLKLPEANSIEMQTIARAIMQLQATMKENETARANLEVYATTDALTGLSNRRHFMAEASAEVTRAHRCGRPIAVGLADLDFFKRINDTYGHDAGDRALCAFAQLMRQTLRVYDLACRYGGEEFALLFPETTPEDAFLLAERLRQRLGDQDIALPDGQRLRITLSIGIADASALGLESALHHADNALYEAKTQGRNRVVAASTPAEPPQRPLRMV